MQGLEEYVSNGAAYDSAERGADAPKCHPETRKAVQEEILSWIERGRHDANPTTLLWLSGPAGSGKTAIAGTIAEECQAKGWFAASFFFSAFSGGVDRRSKRYLIPTLAYHLLQQKSIPGLKEAILASIAENPSVFERRLDKQLDILILEPLRTLGIVNRSAWPKVIIIDGLDECNQSFDKKFETDHDRQVAREEDHREILSALWRASREWHFPFRILLASRPEQAISTYFSSTPDRPFKEIFLDDKYNPEVDIEKFSRASLVKIGRDRGLQENWFAKDVPRLLAQEASGQFVYATTALRFVRDPTRPPHEQLKRVMEWRRFDDSQPFVALDALYTGILETSPIPTLAAKWLFAIDAMKDKVDKGYRQSLLESFPGEARYVLGTLNSLINLDTFHFYHKSLFDYLQDHRRSTALHVSIADADRFLANRYYQVLKSGYSPSFRSRHVLTLLDRRQGPSKYAGEFKLFPPAILRIFAKHL